MAYSLQAFGKHHFVEEERGSVFFRGELVVRNVGDDRLAEVQILQIGHHLDFGPVVTVHLAFDFQATHVLDVRGVVQHLRAQTAGFQQVD